MFLLPMAKSPILLSTSSSSESPPPLPPNAERSPIIPRPPRPTAPTFKNFLRLLSLGVCISFSSLVSFLINFKNLSKSDLL